MDSSSVLVDARALQDDAEPPCAAVEAVAASGTAPPPAIALYRHNNFDTRFGGASGPRCPGGEKPLGCLGAELRCTGAGIY